MLKTNKKFHFFLNVQYSYLFFLVLKIAVKDQCRAGLNVDTSVEQASMLIPV
jgi:hypothetical protein